MPLEKHLEEDSYFPLVAQSRKYCIVYICRFNIFQSLKTIFVTNLQQVLNFYP